MARKADKKFLIDLAADLYRQGFQDCLDGKSRDEYGAVSYLTGYKEAVKMYGVGGSKLA